MVALPLVLAALALVAPDPGATVPTLREGHERYFALPRSERLKRWGDGAFRAELAKVGSVQRPLRLAWIGVTNGVFRLTVTADGDEPRTFALTNRCEAYLVNLKLFRRYRWRVESAEVPGEFAEGEFTTASYAPRALYAEGVGNFRDLGGWPALDGARVREGMILRSAGLRDSSRNVGHSMLMPKYEMGEWRITPAGVATLREEFGVKTDLELRTRQECVGMRDSALGVDVRWVHIPFAAYDLIDSPSHGKEPFVRIFELFLDRANYPVLFHCSGGCDRTGTLAFLLNALLGVAEENLCRDWEFSAFSDPSPNFEPSRLQRLLDYLHRLPGGCLREQVESYARGCGITDAQLAEFRAIMLEKPQ